MYYIVDKALNRMDHMKIIYFEKHNTNPMMDQIACTFLMALMAIIWNIIWLVFRLFRPLSLGV